MSIFSPLGFLYRKITDARNALYDRGVLRSYSLGARTISIGNITAGGTGKTPLVAHVAEILADAGEKVCILTRGYGRENPRKRVLVSDMRDVLVDARTGGDEPVELARKLIGKAIVVSDRDRVAAAAWAKDEFGVTAFVLDDGFQHRRAKRDVDIVCIDATGPFGHGEMLPAGTLREPLKNLRRAGAVVVTRGDLVEDASDLTSNIRSINSTAALFRVDSKVVNFVRVDEFLAYPSAKASDLDIRTPSLSFCGLGNPKAFFSTLKKSGCDVAAEVAFPDHHFYTQADIDRLEQQAREAKINALLTTAKDAVKLQGLKFEVPCYVVEVKLEVDDAEGFRKLITSS